MKINFTKRFYDAATSEQAGTAAIIAEIKSFSQNVEAKTAEQKAAFEGQVNQIKAGFDTQLAEQKTATEEIKASLSDVKVIADRAEKAVDELNKKAATSQMFSGRVEGKTFNEYLSEAIKENEGRIKEHKHGDDLRIQLKAAGDMSYTSNFPTGGTYTQEIQNTVYPRLQERIYLSDILPGGRTDKASVTYPQANGGEGGVAVWAAGAKPKLDFDFTSQSAYVKWLAGIVRVPREMLDDMDFLNQFIQQEMLLSLKNAENNFILNGSGADTNPVAGLLAVATAYNGTLTAPVDRMVDAAWGQIVENDMQPTHFILQPRDAVKIGLNKATGSGEYDLPDGSVVFANGQLSISGLNTVPSKLMTANNFLALDRNGAMFIRRMNPELRVTDVNKDDFETNMITFRIEERVTLITPYPKAFVKGLLTPP